MLTIKTGKGHEYRRTLRARNWNTAYDMEWLKEYDERQLAYQEVEMTTESDDYQYSLVTSNSNHNYIDSNSNSNLLNVCDDTNALASDREGIG